MPLSKTIIKQSATNINKNLIILGKAPAIIPAMNTIAKLITSPDCYLTARTALNVFSEEMTGDWHFHDFFLSTPHEYYVEQPKKTPWGDKGIIEVSNVLRKFGVSSDDPNSKKIYTVDHYRALADLFYNRIKNGGALRSLFFDINDYLNTEQQKDKLFNGYLKGLNNTEIHHWNKNRTDYEY